MNNQTKKWIIALTAVIAAGCASTEEQAAPAAPEAAETKPVAEAQTAAPAQTESAAANDSYTVARGDHLWGISSQPRIYGNPYQWPLIYKANSDQIKDADLINPGQVFTINRNASASDVDAAVRHAKTRGAWTLGATEASDKAYLSK